jgi:N-methylhydantoinase A
MFTMDVGRDFARSTFARGDGIKAEPIAAVYAEMEAEAHETLAGMAVETSEAQLTRTAEFRYVGQFHEVEIPIPGGEITQEVVVDAIRRFHIRHEEMFSFAMPWQEVEMSTCRLLAAATPPPFSLPVSEHHTDVPVPARSRACRWAGRTIDTPVYRANELEAGHVLSGPAVIEAELTTVAIPEGWRLEVDRHRNYVLER